MALKSFSIKAKKSIVLAETESVPPVMVIAGPNGVGKSTLLYAIKGGDHVADSGTRFLYQGPHRVLRRTAVQRRWLGGKMRGLLELLSMNDVSGYEGLNFFNPTRTPENVDEAGGTIKHTLGKIENQRQALLAKTVDSYVLQGKELDAKRIPDIYAPLRKLTEFLLPHLVFDRVDFSNEDSIQCLWKRTDATGSIAVDIDELSSGEKAIIVLFLPLLEEQIQARLAELESFGLQKNNGAINHEHRVVLIDEPEQHLHPDLQAKILTYMRNVSKETPTQFVITTHSPTILDQAFDTELFFLGPPINGASENQLRRIATNAERLEALKQLAGSAYFLTTGRVIVCIEGERDSDPEKATDARLFELLYPRATAVTLVPTTGKGNVINTVTKLRDNIPEEAYRIRVRGLVDADQSTASVAGVEILPVCMIENFLLDSTSLFEYLDGLSISTFKSPDEVLTALRNIASEFRDKEIELRTRRRLKSRTVRLGGASVESIRSKQALELSEIQNMLPSDEELKNIVGEVTNVVDGFIRNGTELESFRGKEILDTFYGRHISPSGIGYNEVCIDLAKLVAEKGLVAKKLDPVFDKLLA